MVTRTYCTVVILQFFGWCTCPFVVYGAVYFNWQTRFLSILSSLDIMHQLAMVEVFLILLCGYILNVEAEIEEVRGMSYDICAHLAECPAETYLPNWP